MYPHLPPPQSPPFTGLPPSPKGLEVPQNALGGAENWYSFAQSSAFLRFFPLILVTKTDFREAFEVSATCFGAARSVFCVRPKLAEFYLVLALK